MPVHSFRADSETELQRGFVDRYLPALLNQAANCLTWQFAEEVRSHGISVLEWRVLATLSDSDRIPVGMLARRAVTKQPTLTRLLERLERQGHVLRDCDPVDRRQTLVQITPAGRSTVIALMERAEAQQKAALAHFGSARWTELETLLHQLIDLSGMPAEPDQAPDLDASF